MVCGFRSWLTVRLRGALCVCRRESYTPSTDLITDWELSLLLKFQQPHLRRKSSAKSVEFPIRTHYPMTRKKDGERIFPNSACDCSDRSGVTDSCGEFFVADSCATRDREKCLPDLDLEFCSFEIKTHASRVDFFSGEIIWEELFCIFEMHTLPGATLALIESYECEVSIWPDDASEAFWARNKGEYPEWRWVERLNVPARSGCHLNLEMLEIE